MSAQSSRSTFRVVLYALVMLILLVVLFLTRQPLLVIWVAAGMLFLTLVWRLIRAVKRLESAVDRLESQLDENKE